MDDNGNPGISTSEFETPESQKLPSEPLSYQETPIIDPVPQEPPQTQSPAQEYSYTSPQPASSPVGTILKALVGFVVLFIVGYVASGYIRQYLAGRATTPTSSTPVVPASGEMTTILPITKPTGTSTTTAQIDTVATTASGSTISNQWKTYTVTNGSTRKPIEAISFQLPATVLSTVCDGSACGSQGTYLPGGTRFTVAPRGQGQVLADYRNKIISDLSGKAFTVKETTVKGKKAVEFSGSFTGSTIGGYAFSRMHGYMIEVTDTMSLEINHFIPAGITADFDKDDILFTSIIDSLSFTAVTNIQSTVKPTVKPTVKAAATVAPSATSSSQGM